MIDIKEIGETITKPKNIKKFLPFIVIGGGLVLIVLMRKRTAPSYQVARDIPELPTVSTQGVDNSEVLKAIEEGDEVLRGEVETFFTSLDERNQKTIDVFNEQYRQVSEKVSAIENQEPDPIYVYKTEPVKSGTSTVTKSTDLGQGQGTQDTRPVTSDPAPAPKPKSYKDYTRAEQREFFRKNPDAPAEIFLGNKNN